MNATIFVVGSFIENSNETTWSGNLKTEYPNIEIYSHTYNLHYECAINENESILIEDMYNQEMIITMKFQGLMYLME